jgi:hypothetical protein
MILKTGSSVLYITNKYCIRDSRGMRQFCAECSEHDLISVESVPSIFVAERNSKIGCQPPCRALFAELGVHSKGRVQQPPQWCLNFSSRHSTVSPPKELVCSPNLTKYPSLRNNMHTNAYLCQEKLTFVQRARTPYSQLKCSQRWQT